ncbi:acetyl/propionyl/methylcrotonyl-CoA carboxylase subunit alpha [Sneathiella limimaris]|uniref:acetyl/propionyl/methylcrotonyl-CoA carboxylase subunit alpha n=1 Tax=Sneathiella limimaris TaxID=1964213 RepID=UPI00146D344E|nr:acetyl-CoA carboxylase biotin carboxylase subunit [Sneathiella limimaris]
MSEFSKILIANRGEIACRVIKTAHAMGYETVAVYSDPDRGARHVKMATEAIHIGPAAAAESYLNIESIIAAAKKAGADAVHPGYGFLSENADFAARCEKEGLTFIGPPKDAIHLMGNKAEAKRRMIHAKVPCVPGYEDKDQSDDQFVSAAERIGYPVMVKAAAGGGGRGMRLVTSGDQLKKALETARSEAKNAFGSNELILEKAVVEPRHIEIQILADAHGNCIHLGERDCSIQRRHQKVIEEAPSPAVSETLRTKMGEAAVSAAKAIHYSGAGTVEFLLSQDGEFYFLEMNTRLQVEHPVTELVTGFDLVEWQIRIARGEPLPVTQQEVQLKGHAIEARLYAEDPSKNFLPRVGKVHLWQPAKGEGLRCDHGLETGFEITPHYDPMVAKVIAYGSSREDARRRLMKALKETLDLGLTTNRQFLVDCLDHENFASGKATTGFIENFFPKKALKTRAPSMAETCAAVALQYHLQAYKTGRSTDGWDSSSAGEQLLILEFDGKPNEALIRNSGDRSYQITLQDQTTSLQLLDISENRFRFDYDGHIQSGVFVIADTQAYFGFGTSKLTVEDITHQVSRSDDGEMDSKIMSPMNGRVLKVMVKAGEAVTKGQSLFILEAMKMEHDITAKSEGVIEKLLVSPDQQVASKALLAEIKTT